jgi:hypothetical protein
MRSRQVRRRAFRPLHLLSLAVAIVVGVAIAMTRVNAAPPTVSIPVMASVSASSPIDYAEVQTDADFPAGMSPEEKDAIGAGKVPIHKEGKYKSPLAHPRFGEPAHVKVGVVLVAAGDYDLTTGKFSADFYLSLTGDRDMPPLSLTFTNGDEVTETVIADTATFKVFRYHGSFLAKVDLRGYPFDKQELPIELEDLRAGVDQLVFVPDPNRTSLDEGFELKGWSTASIGARAYRHAYPPRFDRDDLYVSRYKFILGIERFGTSAAFSVFVPAFIIVLISLTGMWVPPDELEVRSNAGAPMLAAAVLFHYSLTQALPATGYLTRADKLMMAVYACLLINMISTWFFMIVPEEKVNFVFRFARTWVPIASVALMAAGVMV